MNIKNFLKKEDINQKYASSFRRTTAAMIDIWIVLFLRVLIMQALVTLWLNSAIINFMKDFSDNFGTETIKNTPQHLEFVTHHRIFFYSLIFYGIIVLVGTFYHALLNSSSWQGTIGKRLMKILMVEESDQKISFKKALAHYFLSVLPFIFVLYLVSYKVLHNINFYQTVTASELNVFFGIVFVIWMQAHLFTKKKTTAYDIICKTTLIDGKTSAKFPWTKD
jgi:uncharacterized RDD family membrane protein YckC